MDRKKKVKKKIKLKAVDEGRCLSVKLPEECGGLGYSVRCIYRYDEKEQKIFLSMWLLKDGIDDEFRINSQEIDTPVFSWSVYLS